MVSREFHQDAIAKLTRSYELRLSASAPSGEGRWVSEEDLSEYQGVLNVAEKEIAELREKIAQLESPEGDAEKEIAELLEKIAQLESPEGDAEKEKDTEDESAPADPASPPSPGPEADKKPRGKKS